MSDSGSSGVKASATGNVRDKAELEEGVTNTSSAGNEDKNVSEMEGNGQNGRKVSYSGGEGDQDEPVFRPPSPIAGTSSQPDGKSAALCHRRSIIISFTCTEIIRKRQKKLWPSGGPHSLEKFAGFKLLKNNTAQKFMFVLR
jgi:hypothetical protein